MTMGYQWLLNKHRSKKKKRIFFFKPISTFKCGRRETVSQENNLVYLQQKLGHNTRKYFCQTQMWKHTTQMENSLHFSQTSCLNDSKEFLYKDCDRILTLGLCYPLAFYFKQVNKAKPREAASRKQYTDGQNYTSYLLDIL